MVPEVFFAFNPINRILHGSGLEEPEKLFLAYDEIWKGQFTEGQNNIDYFYKVRDEFNSGKHSPEVLLFLLARVVKGAIRYNSKGQINQSCDKKRYGTKPQTLKSNALQISGLLKGKTTYSSLDYKEVLRQAKREI